jgi:hypothetical protein
MPRFSLAIIGVLVALASLAYLSVVPSFTYAARTKDPYEAALAYVGCMRDHGIPLRTVTSS